MPYIENNGKIEVELAVNDLQNGKKHEIIDCFHQSVYCELFATKTKDNIVFKPEIKITSDHMMDVEVKYVIVNQNDRLLDICQVSYPIALNCGWENPDYSMKLDEYTNEDNGYVKDGVTKIEVMLSIIKIDKLMWKSVRETPNEFGMDTAKAYYSGIRSVLVEKSKYFDKYIRQEKKYKYIQLEEGAYEAWLFVELLHNCGRPFKDQTVGILLKLSVKYECPVEIQQCEKYIIESTTIPMIQKLKYADTYKLKRLMEYCLYELSCNGQINKVKSEKDYASLSLDLRVKILEIHEKLPKPSDYVINGKISDFSSSDKWFRDTVLNVGGVEFHVDKEILKWESEIIPPVDLSEPCFVTKTNEIMIEDVAVDDLNELLQMIYQPTNPVTCSNFKSMLELSNRYKVKFILGKCQQYLIDNPNIDFIDKLIYAGIYDMDRLTEHCMTKIITVEDVQELKKSEKFDQIGRNVLGAMMEKIMK